MSYTANSSDGPTTSGNVTYLLEDEMEDSRTNFNLCYTKISLRIECSFLFQVMCGKIKNVRSESGTRIFSTFSIFFNFLEKCLCGRNSGILSNVSCQLLSRFSPQVKSSLKIKILRGIRILSMKSLSPEEWSKFNPATEPDYRTERTYGLFLYEDALCFHDMGILLSLDT